MTQIDRTDLIIEILRKVPSSLPFLMRKGICGLGCVSPELGSLESAGRRKGFSEEEIDSIVEEINRMGNSSAA